jgi:hypothetical protein
VPEDSSTLQVKSLGLVDVPLRDGRGSVPHGSADLRQLVTADRSPGPVRVPQVVKVERASGGVVGFDMCAGHASMFQVGAEEHWQIPRWGFTTGPVPSEGRELPAASAEVDRDSHTCVVDGKPGAVRCTRCRR